MVPYFLCYNPIQFIKGVIFALLGSTSKDLVTKGAKKCYDTREIKIKPCKKESSCHGVGWLFFLCSQSTLKSVQNNQGIRQNLCHSAN